MFIAISKEQNLESEKVHVSQDTVVTAEESRINKCGKKDVKEVTMKININFSCKHSTKEFQWRTQAMV